MRIHFISCCGENGYGDWKDALRIEVDGETALEFIGMGELEDNSIARDWNDVTQIERLVRDVANRAKNGEKIEITSETVEWSSYYGDNDEP